MENVPKNYRFLKQRVYLAPKNVTTGSRGPLVLRTNEVSKDILSWRESVCRETNDESIYVKLFLFLSELTISKNHNSQNETDVVYLYKSGFRKCVTQESNINVNGLVIRMESPLITIIFSF